ncbi:hypothetical protein CSB37_02885 [bacterium DOLZORAL124_38_8]|nr:MAG: hypothetical protein CSB37_02885 [bacterium DOLZORAL124_38_8]
MFQKGEIWAYPTNTSFGLGARIDDIKSLQTIHELKQRPQGKFFSLMVRDFAMLQEYAEVPDNFPPEFFTKTPRTALLKPRKKLPQTQFWPTEKVGFRICQIPEIAQHIEIPITTTSANLSGNTPLFMPADVQKQFSDSALKIFAKPALKITDFSEIWDFTQQTPVKIR